MRYSGEFLDLHGMGFATVRNGGEDLLYMFGGESHDGFGSSLYM